ncbi:MAG TPA: hypothetical protein VFQ53_04645 [Kofleriaceae bacterium]|nr:hypothetical protein [Kofleriaceae bacterium]
MKNKIDSMEILDALADAAARHEVEHGEPTVESRAAAARIRGFIDERLAAMRRTDLEDLGPVGVERRAIRPDLLGLARDALVARLECLAERFPALGFAHRNFRGVSDDDLRTMIEDAEAAMEHVS